MTRMRAISSPGGMDPAGPPPAARQRLRRSLSRSLVDHRAQAGLGDVRVPVALVDEVVPDMALAVDDEALGHRLDAPRRRDLAEVVVAGGWVEVDLKRRSLRQRLAHRLPVPIRGQRDDLEVVA